MNFSAMKTIFLFILNGSKDFFRLFFYFIFIVISIDSPLFSYLVSFSAAFHSPGYVPLVQSIYYLTLFFSLCLHFGATTRFNNYLAFITTANILMSSKYDPINIQNIYSVKLYYFLHIHKVILKKNSANIHIST